VPPPKGYKLVLPFTRSAIALGRTDSGLSSIEPDGNSGQEYSGEEVSGGLIVSSCDGAELLEPAVEILERWRAL